MRLKNAIIKTSIELDLTGVECEIWIDKDNRILSARRLDNGKVTDFTGYTALYTEYELI